MIPPVPMDPVLAQDAAAGNAILDTTVRYAKTLLDSLDTRPPAVAPFRDLPPSPLAEEGGGFDAALGDFQTRWAQGLAASAGPRYLGFVVGGVTPAALAGDVLCTTFDQNPQTSLDSNAINLEREALGWLRTLFKLSDAHRGSLVSGATQSNVVGLAIGREWCGEEKGVSVSEQGLAALGPVRVLSGCPHSSVYKALSNLGLGKQAMQLVPLIKARDDDDEATNPREAVDVAALEAALADNPAGVPTIVVANAGTVNTGDFDDIAAIMALKEKHRFFLHVDGAFGGFAAVLNDDRARLVEGWDGADSICIDLHKWLNVPYDSAVQFSRHQPLQARVFSNAAAYLAGPTSSSTTTGAGKAAAPEPDFVSLTPENSRRFRALPAWFSLRAYGRRGHAAIVARNLAQARAFGAQVAEHSETFRLLAPVRLNVVCFTLSGADAAAPEGKARVQAWLDRIRADGETFLSPTQFRGQWAARAAFSNWRTTEADAARAFAAVLRAAEAVKAEEGPTRA